MAGRLYGDAPYKIVVVHGGPGAPGEVAPVARELKSVASVMEPFQGADSLSGQIVELANQIKANCAPPVALVGWSWGAWLSLIVAAEYPDLVSKLILISSGPFEDEYSHGILNTRLSRMNEEDKEKAESLIARINANSPVDDEEFKWFGEVIGKADSYAAIPRDEKDMVKSQSNIYQKVWPEADYLRKSGKLIEYARNVKCPVTVIHGKYDPHPFDGVQKPLSQVLPNTKYYLLEHCGHTPWLEKEARIGFFDTMKKEISTSLISSEQS